MHFKSLCFLMVLILVGPSQICMGTQPQNQSAIKDGLRFLIECQNDDGSWRSEYYGNLKQGAAITSLALFAISNCDLRLIEEYEPEICRAFDFQRLGIKKNGYVSNVSGPDYAVYGTSFLILANENFSNKLKVQKRLNDKESRRLREFLCNAQLDETHGLTPGDFDYGGWDLSGWMQSKRNSPGTNVSVSSFAIQALASDPSDSANQVREKLLRWTQRIKNPDGGFHFHPRKDHEGNKAGWSDDQFLSPKSYGTSTADGIRILKALLKSKSSLSAKQKEELRGELNSAVKWIEQQKPQSFVPGFERSEDASWKNGLFYYYSMSLMLEMDTFSDRFGKQSELIASFLINEQKSDGSWSNPSTRMREDDPLIATCFALVALSKRKTDSQSLKRPKKRPSKESP